MPKLFVHSREGTFSSEARSKVAAALTDLGMECERLSKTEHVREGVWVWFSEHAPDAVFSGGKPVKGPIVALVVYALEGGLDDDSRTKLIAGATTIFGDHLGSSEPAPVYVVIQETPEADWGMQGRQVSLAALRDAS
ncbi:tautomerase family protein [Sphingomonas sp. CROZ-RG-20F-R02-07]|uniref:tautomerase family protein n=1 Tax=Sphingomonas sp. CROZ-RG-20F-R02-07 TaxID=2914832 RepID=UPI001F592663|nr:tautomerase family protein [Sphingomonas sp. CROZ-RG-20F-R02-07]